MKKCIESTMSGKNLDYDHLLWINKIAKQFDLTGITFFHNDGSVKVIAEGEENNLLFFVKKLKRGPSFFPLFSPVENFSVIWEDSKNEFKNFSISEAME